MGINNILVADATTSLLSTREELMKAAAEHAKAEYALANHRADIVRKTDPKELGANESQREAALRKACEEDYARLHRADIALIEKTGAHDMARTLLRGLQMQIDLLNISEGASNGAVNPE